jgi:hypothetical protein
VAGRKPLERQCTAMSTPFEYRYNQRQITHVFLGSNILCIPEKLVRTALVRGRLERASYFVYHLEKINFKEVMMLVM